MRKSLDELLAAVKALTGENKSDDVISLIEDITDSYSESDDWRAKYDELEAAKLGLDDEWRFKYNELEAAMRKLDDEWRERYINRFGGEREDREEIKIKEKQKEPEELTIEDIFKEEEK